MPRLIPTLLSGVLFTLLPHAKAQETSLLNAEQSNSRFLTQATFGPKVGEIKDVFQLGFSGWFLEQTLKPASYQTPIVEGYSELEVHTSGMAFWKNAVAADDQLRQRMAFALSQIFVISDFSENELFDYPAAVSTYQDLLIKHAFGNYRDLLEAVTYSPAMGFYLTYMGNEKGDKQTGRVPDENYAREILQLFSIGQVRLNMDASPVLDAQGQAMETYTNRDVTGLAKVFTGLNLSEAHLKEEDEDFRDDGFNDDFRDSDGFEFDDEDFEGDFGDDFNSEDAFFAENEEEEEEDDFDETAYTVPMQVFEDSHSELEKAFLGLTIPANTKAKESISMALDKIFMHPNVPPFISRQLIQRFVTSNPSPQYIERVAYSFASGYFELPNGETVGTYKRGDLKATLAAILFDEEARNDKADTSFGKVREPILRFTAWARAFEVEEVTPMYIFDLWDTSRSTALGQHPYRSPSVFNFYQPDHMAYGTKTGMANLAMPELQLVNSTTIPSYINFMSFFINREMRSREYVEEFAEFAKEDELDLDIKQVKHSFYSPYKRESQLAHNPDALIAHLDTLLTYGRLSPQTKGRIAKAINLVPKRDKQRRVEIAILMVMTAPEFLVQS